MKLIEQLVYRRNLYLVKFCRRRNFVASLCVRV